MDGSDLPAYANGHRTGHDGSPREPSDPDASCGHRSAVSTRNGGGFYGYKVDAAVDVATGLPVAWNVRSAKHAEQNFALPLIEQAPASGFAIKPVIADKGYDSTSMRSGSRRGVRQARITRALSVPGSP